MQNKLIRRAKAAGLLGVNPYTLKRWEARGILTPVRLGGLVFYQLEEIERIVEKGRK